MILHCQLYLRVGLSLLPGIGFRDIRGQILGKEELLVFLGVHFRIVNLSVSIEGGLVYGQLRFTLYSVGIRAVCSVFFPVPVWSLQAGKRPSHSP